jgi:hypothetical protein
VAKFKATFLVMANGTLRTTHNAIIPYVHSEYSVNQSEEVSNILSGDCSSLLAVT